MIPHAPPQLEENAAEFDTFLCKLELFLEEADCPLPEDPDYTSEYGASQWEPDWTRAEHEHYLATGELPADVESDRQDWFNPYPHPR